MTIPLDEVLAGFEADPRSVDYADALAVLRGRFGEPVLGSATYAVFRTPWGDDPRVSIVGVKGRIKPFQVQLVVDAARRGLEPTPVKEAPAVVPGREDSEWTYSYYVGWDSVEKTNRSGVEEFPSLTWCAPFHNRALNEIEDLTERVIRQMRAAGEPVPPPTMEVPVNRVSKALKALFSR